MSGRPTASYGVALLFGLFLALRVVHPSADPPADLDWSAGVFFDEGLLVHGARNKILFGRWDLDEWNDFYLSPILAYIKWVVLSVLGVGLAQERVIPIAFSVLTLVVFYRAFAESFDRRTAVVTTLLLGGNYVFLMFNRLGLTETSVTFFMVLTAYCWQRAYARAGGEGGYRLRPALFFLAGVSAFAAYVFKNFPYFLPVPVVATLLSWRLLRRAPSETGDRAPRVASWLGALALCLVGMAIAFVPWYVLFYRPYAQSINQALRFLQDLSVPGTLEQVLSNVSRLPFFEYFVQTPMVLLFSSLAIGYVIHLYFHDRDALRPLDLFMLCWFLAHFFLYAVLTYRPVRYFVPVIPPMCALAGRTMVAWSETRAVRVPERVSVASMPFLAAWLTVLLGYEAVQVAARFRRVLALPLLDRPLAHRLLGAAVLAALLVGLAAVACRRWGGRSWPVPRPVVLGACLAVPLAVFVAVNGYRYLQWAAHPRYLIRDISRELGRTLSHAYIAGLGAPTIVLENRHRAIHVYENFFNYRDTFDRFPVTHLFMGAYNQEVDFYYRKFPEPMRRAMPLRVYAIKDSNFYLYSLVEPSIASVRPTRESYRVGEDVAVTLAVKNNDAANRREVTAGWILQPVEPGADEVRAMVPIPLRLGPGETAEVTLAASAPPGSYRLLAFTLPGYENVFEGEFLSHRIGDKRRDPAALNGETWRVQAADPRHGQAVFGPYLRYPPGLLTAAFRLKVGDNRIELPVARIDVATESARKFLAAGDLRGVDFAASRAYQEFTLSQLLDNAQTLEFRVGSYMRADLWVDRIRVEFTPGAWYSRPISVAAARR